MNAARTRLTLVLALHIFVLPSETISSLLKFSAFHIFAHKSYCLFKHLAVTF